MEWNALVKYVYTDSIRATASTSNTPFIALQASDYQVLKRCRLQQILMVASERERQALVQMQMRHLCALLGRRERAFPKLVRLTAQFASLNKVQLPKPPVLEVQLWKDTQEQILITQ